MPFHNVLVTGTKLFCLSLATLSALGPGKGLHGQGLATLQVEENVRSEPQGVVLGRILSGAALPVVSRDGPWVQLRLEGWIWTRSLQTTDRLGFDLVVSAVPRENLRSDPGGGILATLVEGTLLDQIEDVPGWTRVRRSAWVWAESLELSDPPASPEAEPAPSIPQAPGEEGWWRGGPGGVPVLSGPDGDTLAFASPGADLRVMAREGNWIRVRLEGWSWAPEGELVGPLSPDAIADLTIQDVAQDPELHRGSTVSWELQFISLERAEKIRTDFYEGEPFLLTRTPSGESLFVYVAVPPDRVGEMEGLVPLERIRIVGRLRSGAAALTGNPILDLLEFTRVSRD